MPEFTVTVTDKAHPKLQAIVARHNADQGTNLSVTEWLDLHVAEILIAEELAATAERLRTQAESDARDALQAAFAIERQRLLESMK